MGQGGTADGLQRFTAATLDPIRETSPRRTRQLCHAPNLRGDITALFKLFIFLYNTCY